MIQIFITVILVIFVHGIASADSATFVMKEWVQNQSFVGEAITTTNEGGTIVSVAEVDIQILSDNEISVLFELITDFSATGEFRLRFTSDGSVELLHYNSLANDFVPEGTGQCAQSTCTIRIEHLVVNEPNDSADDELMVTDRVITLGESTLMIKDTLTFQGLTQVMVITAHKQ